MKRQCMCVAILALTACGRAEHRAPTAPANQVQATVPPPGTGPDARTPLGPVKPTIDPKSTEAALAVIRRYTDLLEHRRFDDAAKLWDNQSAATAFAAQLNPEVHVEIGNPGPPEGAAGSIYTTIPVVFFGDTYRKPASVVLRRVNDVPGSTESQRRWHIERIDWTPAG
jgi:hypothetical protein